MGDMYSQARHVMPWMGESPDGACGPEDDGGTRPRCSRARQSSSWPVAPEVDRVHKA